MKQLIWTALVLVVIVGFFAQASVLSNVPYDFRFFTQASALSNVPYDYCQIAASLAAAPAVIGALTIKEFCDLHRISVAFFYVLRQRGEGPVEMHVGSRVLISHEAAADWRRSRETAALDASKRKTETTVDHHRDLPEAINPVFAAKAKRKARLGPG